MPLIQVLVVLLVAGVLMWLIAQAPFIDGTMKTVMRFAILALVVIWLVGLIAGWDVLNFRVGTIRR